MCQTYIPVVQSQPKPLHICLLYTVIVSRIQKSSTGDNSFDKLKGTFWFDLKYSGQNELTGLFRHFISIKQNLRNFMESEINQKESDKSCNLALHVHFSVSANIFTS